MSNQYLILITGAAGEVGAVDTLGNPDVCASTRV